MTAATLASPTRPPLFVAGLAALAVALAALTISSTLLLAGDTLGYDFLAYHAAAGRALTGQPVYDVQAATAGPHGLYLYPPPFLLLIAPFTLVPEPEAVLGWAALSTVAVVVAIALMPVPGHIRWLTLFLGAASWPLVYSLKLGQVGPMLLLVFALAWRSSERDRVMGPAAAIGALIKVQPGVLFLWAAARRRWATIGWGAGTLVVAALAALPIADVGSWLDFVGVLGRVADPITTPHNFTPGAIAFQAGTPYAIALTIQLGSTVAAVGAVVATARRWPRDVSLLVAVTASQLLSPVLWDHYAVVLLLPVAWLLSRRVWSAALIPLASAIPLVTVTPAAWYPLAFWITIGALMWFGRPGGAHAVGRVA